MRLFVEELERIDPAKSLRARRTNPDMKKEQELPHPVKTILQQSTKSGGPLGAHRLAKELNAYCVKELVRHAGRLHLGKTADCGQANAGGVLLALFTPRKARLRLQGALDGIAESPSHAILRDVVTPDDAEKFLKRSHIRKMLARLKSSK
jgi:hypothetical protein